MSRTVGYTASSGAQIIGASKITQHGPLSRASDVPYELFVQELAKRRMQMTSELATCN